MLAILIVTLHDIVGLSIFGLLLIGAISYITYGAFLGWKNSPRRWWNKRK